VLFVDLEVRFSDGGWAQQPVLPRCLSRRLISAADSGHVYTTVNYD
jgi:hypothetical protein